MTNRPRDDAVTGAKVQEAPALDLRGRPAFHWRRTKRVVDRPTADGVRKPDDGRQACLFFRAHSAWSAQRGADVDGDDDSRATSQNLDAAYGRGLPAARSKPKTQMDHRTSRFRPERPPRYDVLSRLGLGRLGVIPTGPSAASGQDTDDQELGVSADETAHSFLPTTPSHVIRLGHYMR